MSSPSFITRNAKKGVDFYETPESAIVALLEREKFTGTILEPCCGAGAISKVLKRKGFKVFSSDIEYQGYGVVKDFFKIEKQFDNIITNPPYSMLDDFMIHCLEIARNKVALLLRINVLEGISRYNSIYSKAHLKRVYVFSKRISFWVPYANRNMRMISYGWFLFDKSFQGNPTIHWI